MTDVADGAKNLKYKRRYCREPGCTRIVKSQGLCQRHGAKPKGCKVEGCPKQAQGNFDGMCKSHFKKHKQATAPLPPKRSEVASMPPPTPVGESVYDRIIPLSVSWKHGDTAAPTPLIEHLKIGFDAEKAPAWHRNEERQARGLWPVSNSAQQLEGWERELVWMEILLLTGNPSSSFRHLARGWGRDKGFHMVLAQFICERHGDVERKKRQRTDQDDGHYAANVWDDACYGDSAAYNEALAADIIDFGQSSRTDSVLLPSDKRVAANVREHSFENAKAIDAREYSFEKANVNTENTRVLSFEQHDTSDGAKEDAPEKVKAARHEAISSTIHDGSNYNREVAGERSNSDNSVRELSFDNAKAVDSREFSFGSKRGSENESSFDSSREADALMQSFDFTRPTTPQRPSSSRLQSTGSLRFSSSLRQDSSVSLNFTMSSGLSNATFDISGNVKNSGRTDTRLQSFESFQVSGSFRQDSSISTTFESGLPSGSFDGFGDDPKSSGRTVPGSFHSTQPSDTGPVNGNGTTKTTKSGLNRDNSSISSD